MLTKSRLAVPVLVLILIISSCAATASVSIPKGINDSLKSMAAGVNKHDMEGFLKFIDSGNKEFYSEEKHWFEDIMHLDVKNYVIQIEGVYIADSGVYKIDFSQAGLLEGNKFLIKSTGIFKKLDGIYKFSDLDFNNTSTDHFIIKYSPSLKKQAEAFSTFAEEAYGQVKKIYGTAPEDKTVIKLYDNAQIFNWYIKPSINFAMEGWYEYPESIKINLKGSSRYDAAELKSRYLASISHELAHRTSMIESNNNIPYWMAEGIATYVQNNGAFKTSKPEVDIKLLENVNLEKLSKPDAISAYYNSAYIGISKFIKKYGMEKLHDLLAKLRKYPIQQKTGGQAIPDNNRKFHEVLIKYMSVTFDQLDYELSQVN